MKKVMVFGTFDIFHLGHISFLKQAQKYGDYLSVVIARDKTVLSVKGKFPKNKEESRVEKVLESGLADEVVLGNENNKYKIIKKFSPNIICLGYDQKFFIKNLRIKLNEFGLKSTKVMKMKSFKPEIYKSSKLAK